MTPNVGYPVDFHKQAINNAVFQRLGSAPASPVAGQFYVNTGDGLLYKRNEANSAWEAIGDLSAKVYSRYSTSSTINDTFDSFAGVIIYKLSDSGTASNVDVNLSFINSNACFILIGTEGGVTITNFLIKFSGVTKTTIASGGTALLYYDPSLPDLTVINQSISDLETTDFAAGVIQTSITGSSTNSQIPTALAVENRINELTVGLWSDQGNYDASSNLFPTTGGSGVGGAILKGDVFRVSVPGSPGGVAYQIGGSFRSLVDTPGQTAGNWATITQDDNTGGVSYATSAEAKAKTEGAKAVPPNSLTDFVYSNAPVQFGNGSLTQFDFTHAFTTVTGVKIKKVSDNQHWTFLVTETSGTNVRVNTGIVPTANEFEIVISGK